MSYSILIMLEYILKKIYKKYICILPFRCDYTTYNSYPEIMEDWIANTPMAMAANVVDKFELENFRPTVAYKSELEVW